MSTKAQREIAHKLKVFAHAEQNGNVVLTCRYFGISRNTFYRWKKNYKSKGEIGLVNSKPCPQNLKLRTPAVIEDKIIYLRQHYHFGHYGSVGIYGVITKLKFQQLGRTMF